MEPQAKNRVSSFVSTGEGEIFHGGMPEEEPVNDVDHE